MTRCFIDKDVGKVVGGLINIARALDKLKVRVWDVDCVCEKDYFPV